jgi:RinA family phage transcriptional activator
VETIRTKHVERGNFKLIEIELYNYHKTKKEYEFLQEEIIQGSAPPSEAIGASRGIDVSKPTENKAIQLTSPEILELRKRIDAIKYAIRMLDNQPEPKKKELLELKYFSQRYSDIGIMEKLHIERRTLYKWRREIISLIASQLGWKV